MRLLLFCLVVTTIKAILRVELFHVPYGTLSLAENICLAVSGYLTESGPKEGWVMVKSSDKTWSTGEGSCKLHQYSCFENLMKSMKR